MAPVRPHSGVGSAPEPEAMSVAEHVKQEDAAETSQLHELGYEQVRLLASESTCERVICTERVGAC